jgi:photosystem II stability/assembly factor-like uncharacterized protein
VRKVGVIAMVALAMALTACTSSTAPSPTSSTSSTGTTTTTQARPITATSSPPQDVDAVDFLNANVGWATENNSTRLLMTTDGGVRWRDVSPPMLLRKGFILAGGLAGASFLSPSDFWVTVYDLGPDRLLPVLLFHTTDGGRHWVGAGSLPRGVGQAWVSFLNDQQGWVAVGNGDAAGTGAVTIYETTSGGEHWSVVSRSRAVTGARGTPDNPGPCEETGLSISGTTRAPVLWLTGWGTAAPCLERSTDGGRRWGYVAPLDPSPGGGGEVLSPVVFSGSRGALVDSYGSVMAFYSTSNGGYSWVEHRPPRPRNGPMDVVSPTTWFVMVGKVLYLTTDAGVTWTSLPTDPSATSGSSLDFVNTMDGWTVFRSGRLWHTTDGGRLWKLELLPR